jgi:endogenous inhibitor of DNA gyrase (YacG/DUF329 family)
VELSGVDINGLSPEHQRRISQVGLDRWLDEQCAQKQTAPLEPTPINKSKRTWRNCTQCGTPFLAKRVDARLCSTRCRIRAVRYGHGVGLAETDNQNTSL